MPDIQPDNQLPEQIEPGPVQDQTQDHTQELLQAPISQNPIVKSGSPLLWLGLGFTIALATSLVSIEFFNSANSDATLLNGFYAMFGLSVAASILLGLVLRKPFKATVAAALNSIIGAGIVAVSVFLLMLSSFDLTMSKVDALPQFVQSDFAAVDSANTGVVTSTQLIALRNQYASIEKSIAALEAMESPISTAPVSVDSVSYAQQAITDMEVELRAKLPAPDRIKRISTTADLIALVGHPLAGQSSVYAASKDELSDARSMLERKHPVWTFVLKTVHRAT